MRQLLLILAAFPSLGRIAEISEYGSNLCNEGRLALVAWDASRTVLDLFPLMPLLRVFCLRAHKRAVVMVMWEADIRCPSGGWSRSSHCCTADADSLGS